MARICITGVPGETGDAIRQALEARATLDTTVAGPGAPPAKLFVEVTQQDWEDVVACLREAFGAVREAARRGDDRILLVSCAPAIRPLQGACLQATAGAFLHTVGQVAAVELGPEGTTVNVVAPGFVDDRRFDDAIPTGRATSAQDVAEVCVFLASEAAGGVSGAIVPVDGGFTITKGAGSSPLLA